MCSVRFLDNGICHAHKDPEMELDQGRSRHKIALWGYVALESKASDKILICRAVEIHAAKGAPGGGTGVVLNGSPRQIPIECPELQLRANTSQTR